MVVWSAGKGRWETSLEEEWQKESAGMMRNERMQ